MKCAKCGYDYPAKELKCPYCGEPNPLGVKWQEEEDDARKNTLFTKAKIIHSMPMYVADKVMNIILIIPVAFFVIFFLVSLIQLKAEELHETHQQKLASVEKAEELLQNNENEALSVYLHEYEVYGNEKFEKYTERDRLYSEYLDFLTSAMNIRQMDEWGKAETPPQYLVQSIMDESHEILKEDSYRFRDLKYEENREYLRTMQQNVTAYLMGSMDMTEEEIVELTKIESYSEDAKKLTKKIFERKGWDYEEN